MHQHAVPRNVEIGAEAVEGLLDSLVASRVHQEEHLVAQVPMVWYKDAGPMEEPVVEVPRLRELAGPELLEELLAIGRSRCCPPDVIQEGKGRPGQGMNSHRHPLHGGRGPLLCIPTRQSVHHGENDGLATDLGQPLDEVHRDVGPHLGRHLEGL